VRRQIIDACGSLPPSRITGAIATLLCRVSALPLTNGLVLAERGFSFTEPLQVFRPQSPSQSREGVRQRVTWDGWKLHSPSEDSKRDTGYRLGVIPAVVCTPDGLSLPFPYDLGEGVNEETS
jgi:hypothetical protein